MSIRYDYSFIQKAFLYYQKGFLCRNDKIYFGVNLKWERCSIKEPISLRSFEFCFYTRSQINFDPCKKQNPSLS